MRRHSTAVEDRVRALLREGLNKSAVTRRIGIGRNALYRIIRSSTASPSTGYIVPRLCPRCRTTITFDVVGGHAEPVCWRCGWTMPEPTTTRRAA